MSVKSEAVAAHKEAERRRQEELDQRLAPERERQAAESKRQAIAARRRDLKLLRESPLSEWFPEAKWEIDGWPSYVRATIYKADDVRVMIEHETGVLRLVRKYKQDISSVNCSPPHPLRDSAMRGSNDWWGPLVPTKAQLGREIEYEEHRYDVPSGPGVRLGAEGYPV